MPPKLNLPASQKPSRIRTPSGRSIPQRQPLPPQAPDPEATCALAEHCFDIGEDLKDFAWNPTDEKYYSCDTQPCPNRYNVTHTRPLPVWG